MKKANFDLKSNIKSNQTDKTPSTSRKPIETASIFRVGNNGKVNKQEDF